MDITTDMAPAEDATQTGHGQLGIEFAGMVFLDPDEHDRYQAGVPLTLVPQLGYGSTGLPGLLMCGRELYCDIGVYHGYTRVDVNGSVYLTDEQLPAYRDRGLAVVIAPAGHPVPGSVAVSHGDLGTLLAAAALLREGTPSPAADLLAPHVDEVLARYRAHVEVNSRG